MSDSGSSTSAPGSPPSPSQSKMAPSAGDPAFLGTPFTLERPYEYPFPSPVTESCPNLTLNFIPVASTLSQNQYLYPHHARSTSQSKDLPMTHTTKLIRDATSALASRLPHLPNPPKRNPPSSLKRRATLAHGTSLHLTMSHEQPPVPPGLLGKDLGQLSPRLRAEGMNLLWRRPKREEEGAIKDH
ncbi:hypothetical protein CPB86DRAFT_788380 [Serendipita vermifera]|nr:hypothetical protein CPB86DRAFT_788380 [Serendipita vermifera]